MTNKMKLKLSREKAQPGRPVARCDYNLRGFNNAYIAMFCARTFHKATGFFLEPGETEQIEISINKVE